MQLLSVRQKFGQKAGLPQSAPHVHFAFDGAQTITSLSPPHYVADTACTEEGSSKENLPCAGPASVDGDSLPSVSSIEVDPSEIQPTSSGGWGEGPSEVPSTVSGRWGDGPSEIALAPSVTQMEDEEADSVFSDGEDLQLEPVLCEGEEIGVALEQGGQTGGDGTRGHRQEVGCVASPTSRSACLKKADSIESIV